MLNEEAVLTLKVSSLEVQDSEKVFTDYLLFY